MAMNKEKELYNVVEQKVEQHDKNELEVTKLCNVVYSFFKLHVAAFLIWHHILVLIGITNKNLTKLQTCPY